MTETTFTLPFLGRYQELKSLAEFYDRGWHHGAGFLVMYGRKGVGKTRLWRQFLQEQTIADYFYWQAPSGDAAAQLRDFSQALLRYAPEWDDSLSPDFSFYNWREALDYLAQITERSSGTKLFILEGFTELCYQSMGLSSYFQHAWDHRLQSLLNLRLIIVGSHISTMIWEVYAYSAPLYFRANANLYLQPLRYTALLDLFPDRAPEERLAIYAITGGMPAYLTYFAQTPDILTAVKRLCFAPDSPFLSNMETLFDERPENLALCQTILTAVSDGDGDPNRLREQLNISHDDLQRDLYFLGLIKLIKNSHSVHDPSAVLRVRYAVANPALHFYYRHLKPALEKQSPKETTVLAYASLRESLGGEPFLALCREWIWAAARTKQLGILPNRVGAYWDDLAQTPEFPVAVANSWEKELLVGEAFWKNDRLTTAVLEEIVHNSQRLPQVQADGWTVKQIIFSRRPFTEDVQARAAATGVRLVTLAEMEPLLLKARRQRRWELDNPQPIEIEF
ncbi:MAG: hypothetical protein GY805_12455 [Chloroflexi bacterium]|nr:hypothetical protein [Chloroflexota bacterium]